MAEERPRDLFDLAAERELERRGPLASRMRPRDLDEVIGQRHLLAPGAALRALVDSGAIGSVIFFGPPGTGKTTVARLIAEVGDRIFVALSAVSAGVREVRDAIDRAQRELGTTGRTTLLFLDEIHRFTRAQQDALLPGVEEGVVALIGATTENPFFALNASLLSRMTLFHFSSLGRDELEAVARRALEREGVGITEEALDRCCALAEGDARSVLTSLEVAIAIARTSSPSASVSVPTLIDLAIMEGAKTTRSLRFGQDEHYDLISALIKSMRGSDPDAALYWLARLIAVGEDPRFIARRMMILAAEDVGNADPLALLVATAAAEALDRVGLPEASLHLAQAATYLALAPKSNATASSYWRASAAVRELPGYAVPSHLRDGHYQGAKQLGHSIGYSSPHDDPRGWVEGSYLPEELAGELFYQPSSRGRESVLAERLAELRQPSARESDSTSSLSTETMESGNNRGTGSGSKKAEQ
jgi:putative ATPase